MGQSVSCAFGGYDHKFNHGENTKKTLSTVRKTRIGKPTLAILNQQSTTALETNLKIQST
jgi:hypothetical protein